MPDLDAIPTFFVTPADLRAWFEVHHKAEKELWLGFHKVGSGKPSVTWPQAVDQALCFGWIDGVRKSMDAESYKIRLTPRQARSYWSKVNLKRFDELQADGLVTAAGLAAFKVRSGEAKASYSFEHDEEIGFTPEQEALFNLDAAAQAWFLQSPPWYRRAATWWVISAKQEATRQRRLQQLIECSASGTTVPPLTRPQRGGA